MVHLWRFGLAATTTAAVLGLAACGTQRPLVQTPVDLAIAPIGAAGTPIVTSGDASGANCSVRLRAARIEKSSYGCYLDEHISRGPGVLRFPCTGDGPAKADFGGNVYVGQVERGELRLELTSELDWEDGCRWGTHAEISGTVPAGGTSTQKRLNWTYYDRVIQGSNCSGVCQAKSSFEVKPLTTDAKERPAEDNDSEDDELEPDP